MPRNSLTCFGVGDGWPCADRNHSSFLYQLGNTRLLIDCGEQMSGRYKASGLDYNAIDSIFLSHMHADHIGGLFMLMQGLWLEGRHKALPIYMPGEGIKPVQGMLRAGYIFDELLAFKVRYEALRREKPVRAGGAKVTPFRSTHLDGLKHSFGKKYRQKFEGFCFLVESGKLRIGHSADIGAPEDLEPLLVKPLDMLVCELAHFEAEDMFNYLRGRSIRKIVFVHVGRPLWENLAETKRKAKRMLGGIDVTFAHDLQQIEIGA